MTTSEAADYLGVTEETIRRWARVKPPRLSHVRSPGNRLHFRQADLDAAFHLVEAPARQSA